MALLWMLLAPFCVGFYALSLPLGPNDFWYHAMAGRFICEHGALPHQALSSAAQGFTSPDTPYYYQSWLSEVALFLLLRFGGLSAVVVARSVLVALSFALLSWTGARRLGRVLPEAGETARARFACIGALLGFGMCSQNLDTRPQMFSVPLFAAFVALSWEWPFASHRARLGIGAALCALMIVWSNTHGAFISALLLMGALAGGEVAHLFWRRVVLKQEAAAGSARGLCALFGALLGSACLNPRGAGLFVYAFGMARYPIGRKYIEEWQAPHVSLSQWYNALFFGSFLLLPPLWWRAQKRREGKLTGAPLRAGEVVGLLLLAYLGHDMTRGVIWYALAGAPAIAVLAAAAFAPARETLAPTTPIAAHLNAVLAGVFLLAPLLMLPRIKGSGGLGPAFASRFAPTPKGSFPLGFSNDPGLILDRDTPVEAAAFLRAHPPRGHLWNDMVFGSYLSWATAPAIPPSCDPRVELYPAAFWEEYRRIMQGAPDAARTLQRRGYSDALLDLPAQAKLAARLQSDGWHQAFRARGAVLLRHN